MMNEQGVPCEMLQMLVTCMLSSAIDLERQGGIAEARTRRQDARKLAKIIEIWETPLEEEEAA